MLFTERQKTVLETLKAPATTLLGLHGIKVKKRGDYLNVSACPWCGHGSDQSPNYQCGVREDQGANGYLHSYKCQHAHHSPDGNDTPHYADVLAALGALTEDESVWVQNLRSELAVQSNRVLVKNSSSELRLANPEYKAKLNKRLVASTPATAWLTKTRGLSLDVISHFQLGLSEAYQPKDAAKVVTADALAAPLMGRDGQFYSKYVNYAIPGVTKDNRDKKLKAWSAGPARTYYSTQADHKKRLFVCDGLKDLWAIWDKIQNTDLADELLLITSTNGGSGYPDEWKVPGFWEQWETIYLGHDSDVPDAKTGKRAGDEHAKAIARLGYREMRRVWPVGFKDWNDFFLGGKTADDFESLLDGAYPLSLKELKTDGVDQGTGFFAANPVAVAGNFINGYLYEAVQAHKKIANPDGGEPLERFETVVIRSDGTQHQARTMPAPPGTPAHQLVHRLIPDGTMLDGPVRQSPYCTWKWESVEDFVNGRSKQKPLFDMLKLIQTHLRASIWLPFEDNYTLLACVVVATYVQPIFDAVPLLLSTGPAGSGKTALGIAMGEVCANSPSTPIGQISAASIARLIDQSRGFVVLDDLESVGKMRNGAGQFDDLVQALKLSYNKQSAVKYWTNMKTGSLEKLNFFGIKLINNTRGVDAILGSRMFTIATRKMPEGMTMDTAGRLTPEQLKGLRNDLHTWAFSNATQVAQAYSLVFPNKSSRADEIAAPVKVIALLAANDELSRSLDNALAHQAKLDVQPETSEQVLREALENILISSFESRGMVRTVITVTELMMKMGMMVDANFGKNNTTELSEIESPEFVGRQLKQNYTVQNAEPIRIQLYGKYLRAYELEDTFVQRTLKNRFGEKMVSFERNKDPKDFCRGCGDCDYRNACDIRATRELKDANKTPKPQPTRLNTH